MQKKPVFCWNLLQNFCFFKVFCSINAENVYFYQRLERAAPKRWSKYTTWVYLEFLKFGYFLWSIFGSTAKKSSNVYCCCIDVHILLPVLLLKLQKTVSPFSTRVCHAFSLVCILLDFFLFLGSFNLMEISKNSCSPWE